LKKLKQLNLLLIVVIVSVFILEQPAFAKGATAHASSGHASTSHSTVSKASGSGFKSGSFSSSSKTSKSSSTSSTSKSTTTASTKSNSTTSSTKSVNTNSKALSRIPSSYSSHSVSNNYYYNVDNGGSSFWSNYWMYRALTPEHRTYIVDNSNVVAPAYTGVKSIIPDLITICVFIIVIGTIIYIIRKRKPQR
jgi:cobalamin biosynthesis Mg chelatase CobN